MVTIDSKRFKSLFTHVKRAVDAKAYNPMLSKVCMERPVGALRNEFSALLNHQRPLQR